MHSLRRFLTLCASLVAGAALAQKPATSPAVPAPAAAVPEAAKQPVRERERTIYVPYDQLEKVFQDGGKGVFLPYREFLDLWNELNLKRQEDKEKQPPTEGVVSKAEYTGHVEGQTLVLDAKISVESFKKGWSTVVLSYNKLTGIAEANTGKAVLRHNQGSCDVLLPDKGVYELSLKLMLPIEQSAGKSHVGLALPQANVSRMVITVPGEGLEFEIKPSAAFTTRPAAGQTELSFFFGGNSTTASTLSWGAPQAVTQMTPLLLADNQIRCTLGAGSIATEANVKLRILRAPLAEFKVSIPAGQEVLGVSGDNVKTWKAAAAADGRQQIIVTPDKPVKDDYSFTLQLEGPVAKLPAEVNVPDLVIEGASYARGTVLVYTEPQFDVTPKTQESVVRAGTPAAARSGQIAVGEFRVLKQPYKFSLNVEEAKPQVEVSSLAWVNVQRETAHVAANLEYNVRRVGIFEARVGLPAGLNVSAVVGSDIGEWRVESTGAEATLLVKLSRQMIGAFTLHVEGRELRARPGDDLVLPVFIPRDVTRAEGKVGVSVHGSLEASTKSAGDFQQEDVSSLPPSNDRGGKAEPSLAFRYRDEAKPATLSFKTRDAQVAVEVLTQVEAKEQSTRHEWTLDFEVSYAAIDRVVIAVPKAVANEIRLVDPLVKETHKDFKPEPALLKFPESATYAFWEVVLRNEKTGAFSLTLSHEKQGALEAGKTGHVELLQLHVPGAFQETGQVAVLKDNSLELRNPKPEGLEEIDARELHGPLAKPGVFQAYKYRSLPIKLVVETAKNAYFAVPRAVITHADLTTAVSIDQAQTSEAVYWVKNLDLQFLIVRLPEGASLSSDVFVGKESQQPMKREGSRDLMVRLPSNSDAARSAFPVRFLYATDGAKDGKGMATTGSLEVRPPEIVDVKIFETRHRLFLPDAWHYTSFDGPLTQAVRARGWGRVHHTLRYVLPVFGRSFSDAVIGSLSGAQAANESGDTWSAPPEVPTTIRSMYGFQVGHPGHLEVLRRLGAPATIIAHFRAGGLTFAFEAAAFLFIILLGVCGIGWSLNGKAGFLVFAGVLGMLAVGVLSPVDCLVAIAWLRALVCVAFLWFTLGTLRVLGSRFKRAPKPPPPSAPPPKGPRVVPTPAPAPAAPPAPAPPLPVIPPVPPAPAHPVPAPSTTGDSARTSTTTVSVAPPDEIELPEVGDDHKPRN